MDSDPFNKPAKRHTQECKVAEIHSELRRETNMLSYFKIFNCVKVFSAINRFKFTNFF